MELPNNKFPLSTFSFILRVPFDSQQEMGIVYVWVGFKANPEEARLAEEIAEDMYSVSWLIRTTRAVYMYWKKNDFKNIFKIGKWHE